MSQPLQPHNIARPADWAQLRALASSPCRGWTVRHLHVTAMADTPKSRLPLIFAKMELGTVNAKSYLFHLEACTYFYIIRHIIISACICQFERVGHHHRFLKYEIIIPSCEMVSPTFDPLDDMPLVGRADVQDAPQAVVVVGEGAGPGQPLQQSVVTLNTISISTSTCRHLYQ